MGSPVGDADTLMVSDPSPQPEASTSATGGSAASQADSLDRRSWKPQPVVAFAIRATVFLAPFATAFVAVWAALVLVARPEPLVGVVVWFVLLMGVSSAGAFVAQQFSRQLMPLGALFKMSLVFPDEAPSRFRTAMRARTGRHLARDAAASGAGPASPNQIAAETLVTLLARLSAHDRLTRGHAERVRAYSVMLGEQIGLSPDDIEKLNWAALAHDLGKLDVPESILNKPGRPTEEEWSVLRGHPGAAEGYAASLRPWLGDWVDAATQHHERFDGTGYPAGLRGDEIGLSGRIVAIADAFDVMTAARSYKKPLPAEQARAELLRNAGSQFDPGLVRSFLQISLGRMRWMAGPLGSLTHLPDILRVSVGSAAQTAGNVVAGGAMAASALLVAAPASPTPAEASAFAAVPEWVVVADAPAPTTPAGPTHPSGAGNATGATDGTRPSLDSTNSPTTDSTTTDSTNIDSTTTTPTTTTTPVGTTAAPTTTTTGDTLDDSPPAPPPSTPSSSAPPTTAPTTTPSPTTTPTTTTTTTTTTTAAPSTNANNDARTVTRTSPGPLLVLFNDDFGGSWPDLSTLEVTTSPSRGTASPALGDIWYTPGDGQTSGTDTLVYRICSVAGSCDTATVTITLAIP